MDNVSADTVIIRRFRQNDAEMVQEFFDSMGEESRSFFNVGRGNEIRTMGFFRGERSDHIFWAATAETGSGELMAGLVFIWDIDKKIPWLGVAVRDDWQGRHIGRRLIDTVKDYASDRGYGGILLRTAATNLRGQKLYEHCGFEKLGTHSSGELLYLYRF